MTEYTALELASVEKAAAAIYAQPVCAGHERTLAREIVRLIARIRELEEAREATRRDY